MAADRATGIRRRNALAAFLVFIGSFQMVGYLTGSRALKGIGAASVISPLPRVFSDVDGLETFASEFSLRYRRADGVRGSVRITPEIYGQLGGPYNRRNVYGAALSYAPRLPDRLWTSVYCYGMSPSGPLRRELGFRPEDREFSIRIRTLTRGRSDAWTFEPDCTT
jgi:hypothetical protein